MTDMTPAEVEASTEAAAPKKRPTKPPQSNHFRISMARRLQAQREEATDRLPSTDIAAYASGADGTAVQVKVRVEGYPEADEQAEVKRFAVATYRYCFGEWADKSGVSVKEAR